MNITRNPLWITLLLMGMGLIPMAIGWTRGVEQHYRWKTYDPVPAQIIQSDILTHRGGKGGPSYEPGITYSYVVQGQSFQSNRVLPVGNNSAHGQWAWDICAMYPVNSQTTAWYSPSDPSSAFLLRQLDFSPQIFALFPLIFFLSGVTALVGRIRSSRRPARPVPSSDGWFKLAEEGTLRARFRFWIIVTLIWAAYCTIVLGDYVYLNSFQLDRFSSIAISICCGLILIPLVIAWRYWRLLHDFLDADVFIKQDRIHAGNQLSLRIRQNLLRSLEIQDLSLGANCFCSTSVRTGATVKNKTSEAWSTWEPVIENQSFIAGRQITGETSFVIPPDAQTTNPRGDYSYPYIQWFITLRIQAVGQPKLNARYPIVIEPATRG